MLRWYPGTNPPLSRYLESYKNLQLRILVRPALFFRIMVWRDYHPLSFCIPFCWAYKAAAGKNSTRSLVESWDAHLQITGIVIASFGKPSPRAMAMGICSTRLECRHKNTCPGRRATTIAQVTILFWDWLCALC